MNGSYQIKQLYDVSMKDSSLYLLFILVSLVALSTPSYARLYETPSEAKSRYGAPVKEQTVIMLPLLKGTEELRYHHNGWRIRSAFINNKTVIISYMKLARQGTPDAVLQKDEIQAILKAESGDYTWVKVKKGTKVTNSEKYQEYFNSSSRLWKRGDGAVAWVSGNNALSVISRKGLNYEIQSSGKKEEKRKASIYDF
jgi:hypothetical protein